MYISLNKSFLANIPCQLILFYLFATKAKNINKKFLGISLLPKLPCPVLDQPFVISLWLRTNMMISSLKFLEIANSYHL